jgi:very-short-patch-repair endonuclease
MSIRDLVTRQAGVISLGQAVEHGMSARTVQRRVASGAWDALHPCVYLVGGHRLTDEARVRAAALWAGGRRAAVTGPAAAYWHGMRDRAPELIEVTVPSVTHLRPRPGIALRRRDLAIQDVAGIRELWVADRPFAALETAVALDDGSAFLDRALQRHVRFPALYRSFCRNMGRKGSSAAGRLITAAADRADSAAERLLVRILRDAGLVGWVQQHPFGPHLIDLAFPSAHVAIEVDGWAWHVDVERFRSDRRKGNALAQARWNLLRFTWHDLDGDPVGVLSEIRATLALAA